MQAFAYISMVDLREAARRPLLSRERMLRPWGSGCWSDWTLAEALQEAEVRCAQKQALAPWGCQWFEAWKSNVDRAATRQQLLHVFYFKGMKAKGKMHWEFLHDQDAVQAARKDRGLGASQTAEVAYLDKIGLTYEEHDIGKFEAFLAARTHE